MSLPLNRVEHPACVDLSHPGTWTDLLEAVGLPSLLVLIEARMGTDLLRLYQPEDILQEALASAWRSRNKLEWRGLRSFRSLLLTVADHRIQDLRIGVLAGKRGGGLERRFADLDRARDSDSSGSDGFDIPSPTATPGRLAVLREQAAVMRSALEGVPDELREVVRLRLFEQLSSEEIAERLGLGLSAVKYRYHVGAKEYRRLLLVAYGTISGRESRETNASDA